MPLTEYPPIKACSSEPSPSLSGTVGCSLKDVHLKMSDHCAH